MYVVTNRRINAGKSNLDIFGKQPSEKGPNELRVVKVTRTGPGFRTELLDDQLSEDQVQTLNAQHDLSLDTEQKWYASLAAACDLMAQARAEKKHILIFVHGYNNDMKDVMKTAFTLQELYAVNVVPFSWPANGGGALSGTLAYRDDKQDARASDVAFDRFIGKIYEYHELLSAAQQKRLLDRAAAQHPNNPQAQQTLFTELQQADCKVRLNLACHSMGNYLLKRALIPGHPHIAKLVFDNIALVAADTNNAGHAAWVERLQVRHRLYIVINENDNALGWSRRKPGDEQLARLGHYLKELNARNAYYLDVTSAPWVKDEHSYFKGTPVAKNQHLKKMFTAIFEDGKAEDTMQYQTDINAYRLR